MRPIPIQNLLDSTELSRFGETFSGEEARRLLDFARGSVVAEGGFGYLDPVGNVDRSHPRELYIQCRMIQVFGLAHLAGISEAMELVDLGINALFEVFLDSQNSGFYNSVDYSGKPVDANKLAYGHAFVLLAASTAKACSHPRADELLNIVDEVIEKYFWDSKFNMLNNAWNAYFSVCEPYRGVNANMHGVESFIAAYDVTKQSKYRERAFSITKKVVDNFARNNNWMLPEHFDSTWNADMEFNNEKPADPFFPFGVTIGHLFEWSRLAIQVGVQNSDSPTTNSWILPDAINLYDLAKEAGWSADGTDGFIYTMDWDRLPIVRSRMAWVVSEAIMAAYSLWITTNEPKYLEDFNNWWEYAANNMLDYKNGSWFHELNPQQQVIDETWPGKPDIYHMFNACLLTMYPFTASFVDSIKQSS
ncbi:MAG: AGE family epimerase/isomerase [Actinomycetes bacterium]